MSEQPSQYHLTPSDQAPAETSPTFAWAYLRRRLFVPFGAAIGFGAIAAVVSLMFPDQYVSSAALAPSEYIYSLSAERSAASSLGGRLLGLTGGGPKLIDPVDLTIEYAKSRDFVLGFITKHRLAPELAAVSDWNPETNRLVWDTSIYNPSKNVWMIKENGKSLKPNDTEIYRNFRDRININRIFETGVISINFRHVSPHRAQDILNSFIKDLNIYTSDKQYNKSKIMASSLRIAIANEPIIDIKNELVTSAIGHIRLLSMNSAGQNSVLDIIDNPTNPDEKDGPFRSLICLASAFAGGLLGLSWILISLRLKKSSHE